LFGERGMVECDFVLTADGRTRDYAVAIEGWDAAEKLLAIGFRPSDEAGAVCRVERIRIASDWEAPPRVVISEFAPEHRINDVGEEAEVLAVLRNDGGRANEITARLYPPEGVEVLGDAEWRISGLESGEEAAHRWRVSSGKALSGEVVLRVEMGGKLVCRAEQEIRFAEDARAAVLREWKGRKFLSAGYPRAMDFRHLSPDSIATFECETALLVDFIGNKIEAAREFKRRYPDRLVLMQVNDEPNGLWGSWHTVPREFALKEGLRCRPDVMPMPEFRGYWLLMPGEVVRWDIPGDVEEFEIPVEHPERFVRVIRGVERLPDVLIYAIENGKPNYLRSEYATVVAVDRASKRVRLRRWSGIPDYRWYSFKAGGAYVAPSAGDIYGREPLIKTWLPNLTKFCPRDPRTGMDATEWWARHFARLWYEKIARDEPHPDGYEFDAPPFRAPNILSDCDNDGVADGCEIDGISYWGLGMHRFFYLLRNGTEEWRGIGWDVLLLADSSSTLSQRSFDLLNGSENEEFTGFGRRAEFSPQFDLYMLWCTEARAPRVSYLQSRFPCEVYHDGSLSDARHHPKFRKAKDVRLAIAAACMGLGIHTYRHGQRSDIEMINSGGGRMRFDWDEYHAGELGRYNWLGAPLGEPRRLEAAVGRVIFREDFEGGLGGWTSSFDGDSVAVAPIGLVEDGAKGAALKCEVKKIKMVRPSQTAAVVESGELEGELTKGEEYIVSFDVRADVVYDDVEGKMYSGIWREVGVQLRVGAAQSLMFCVLAGSKWRRVSLTFVAPETGRARVTFCYGAERGGVFFDNVELRRGCAEVMYRLFEHGLVLMNGSYVRDYEFDIDQIGGGRSYRRLRGQQDSAINDGTRISGGVRVGRQDALFLMVD